MESKQMNEAKKYQFTILSDPPSKSNGYKIGIVAGHGTLVKTKAVKDYENAFYLQCPYRNVDIQGWFKIEIRCFFASNRKDLDGCFKVILDCLQSCKVIRNDRQCTEIHAYKFVDKASPRVEITLEEVEL